MTREEAIEIVKKNWPEGRHQIKAALEFLVPELKESEDERIRKELIDHCIQGSKQRTIVSHKEDYKRWLAWLEKQKEQKPGDKDRYMEGYINGMNDALKELKEQPKQMGAYEELKQPVWRKIKKGDYLPCRAYLWKLGFEDKKNFHGDCFVDGYLVPNEAVGVGCDTWYLPVDAIKNLPKEE